MFQAAITAACKDTVCMLDQGSTHPIAFLARSRAAMGNWEDVTTSVLRVGTRRGSSEESTLNRSTANRHRSIDQR